MAAKPLAEQSMVPFTSADDGADHDDLLRKRLAYLVDTSSQSDLARKVATSPQNISRYLKGVKMPGSFCAALIQNANVNASWLMTGQGQPFVTELTSDSSAVASNLVDIAKATKAAADMPLGAVAARHDLTSLRRMKEMLDARRDFTERMAREIRPALERLIADFDQAMYNGKMGHAAECKEATEQLYPLFEDLGISSRADYLLATYAHNRADDERALELIHRMVIKELFRGNALEEEAGVNLGLQVQNVAVAMAGRWRLREAQAMCHMGMNELACRGRESGAEFSQLDIQWGWCDVRLGDMRTGLPRMLHAFGCMPGGEIRRECAPVVACAQLWAGLLDVIAADQMSEGGAMGIQFIAQFACWTEDAKLTAQCQRRSAQRSGETSHNRSREAYLRCLAQALDKASPESLKALDAEIEADRAGRPWRAQEEISASIWRAHLAWVAGETAVCARDALLAARAIAALPRRFSLPPLLEATHQRNVLRLTDMDRGNDALHEFRDGATGFFARSAAAGFRCFAGVDGKGQ